MKIHSGDSRVFVREEPASQSHLPRVGRRTWFSPLRSQPSRTARTDRMRAPYSSSSAAASLSFGFRGWALAHSAVWVSRLSR